MVLGFEPLLSGSKGPGCSHSICSVGQDCLSPLELAVNVKMVSSEALMPEMRVVFLSLLET